MSPREFSSDLRDEEMLNEETSLLTVVPTKSDDGYPLKQGTWMSQSKDEVIEQSKTFFPALQSMILSRIPWFITLRILGEMDAGSFGGDQSDGLELAAAALATTLCNVTGMSLCVGFSFALSTLAGQAKGEMVSRVARGSQDSLAVSSFDDENSESTPNTPIVFLLRGLLIQLMLVLPVGVWWLFGIEDFLIQLGQTPELATHAATYLKILAPSLWIYSIQWTVTAWTQSIGMADVPADASVLGLVLHIPFNFLFCYVMDMGYLGCAYATIMFQTVQCIYINYYLFVYPKGRQRVLKLTGGTAVGRTTLTLVKELKIAGGSLRGFCSYLGLALPGIIVISEWWASECAIFLSGRLSPNPQTTLAAMTIYQSINAFCFMIPCGFSIAGTTRVGNLLGADDPSGASLAGKVSVGLCTVVSGALGVMLYALPHEFFPSLFVSGSDNRAIIEQTAATIPLLSVYVFADGIQTGLNGIVKGCGRQQIIVPIVVFAYWVVGVPLAYYLGLYRSGGDDTLCQNPFDNEDDDGILLCGDVGLVAGMTAGTYAHMFLLAAVVIGTTDWKDEAHKAKQRVIADQNHRERQKRQKQRRQDTIRENEKNGQNKLRPSRSAGYLF